VRLTLTITIKIIDKGNADDVKYYKLIVKSVKGLIATKKQYNDTYGAKRRILQRKLDLLNNTLIASVNRLYDISLDEFNTVLHDEIFTNELTTEDI